MPMSVQGVTKATIFPGPPVDRSGSRAVDGTDYQAGTSARLVCIGVSNMANGTSLKARIGSASAGTTTWTRSTRNTGGANAIFFVVPPLYYYDVVEDGGPSTITLDFWMELDL